MDALGLNDADFLPSQRQRIRIGTIHTLPILMEPDFAQWSIFLDIANLSKTLYDGEGSL